VMLHATIGKDLGPEDRRVVEMYEATDDAMTKISQGNPFDFFPALRWVPTPRNKQLKADICKMRSILHDLLQELKSSQSVTNENPTVPCVASDLLKIAKQENLSDDIIVAILSDLMFSGIESPGNTTCWTLTMLANYPHIQERLRTEVMQVLGPNRVFTLEQIDKLPFLKAVIWETIRFIPVINIPPPRVAEQTIRIDEMDIPKGTVVMTNLYAIFKDSEIFKNPDTFDPDRFLNSKSDPLSYEDPSFSPFNVGPRHCPGGHLAHLDSMMVISMILQRFVVKRPTDELISLNTNWNVIAQPKVPTQISFQPLQTAA